MKKVQDLGYFKDQQIEQSVCDVVIEFMKLQSIGYQYIIYNRLSFLYFSTEEGDL